MPKSTAPKTEETTALASVIEPSSELEIKYRKLSITSNVEGVRAHIEEVVQPILSGEIDVSTDELEKHARGTIADLNKLLDSVDRKRIDTEREIFEPWSVISEELKSVVKYGKEAYRKAKDALDAKAEELKRQKHDDMQIDYEGSVGEEIARLIPFDKIANKSWFTKNYSQKKAYDEMDEKALMVINDMKRLNNQQLDNRDAVLAYYCETVDLGKALDRDAEITAARIEAERKAKEAEEAFRLQPKPKTEAVAAAPKPEPKPAAKDVEHELSDFVIILRNVSVFDVKSIAKFAETTTGIKPEVKKKSYMERKGI